MSGSKVQVLFRRCYRRKWCLLGKKSCFVIVKKNLWRFGVWLLVDKMSHWTTKKEGQMGAQWFPKDHIPLPKIGSQRSASYVIFFAWLPTGGVRPLKAHLLWRRSALINGMWVCTSNQISQISPMIASLLESSTVFMSNVLWLSRELSMVRRGAQKRVSRPKQAQKRALAYHTKMAK